jgi:hypothetical protein
MIDENANKKNDCIWWRKSMVLNQIGRKSESLGWQARPISRPYFVRVSFGLLFATALIIWKIEFSADIFPTNFLKLQPIDASYIFCWKVSENLQLQEGSKRRNKCLVMNVDV